MKTLSTWNFRSIVGKIMLGLVLVTMIGSIDVAPASAKITINVWENMTMAVMSTEGVGMIATAMCVTGVFMYPPPVIYEPPPPPGIIYFSHPSLFIPEQCTPVARATRWS
jgi:hypothetical protein